ncbi:adenylate/guanylate cyclase domain-containing protein [Micromonospora sp. WMMA1363]|uniref:adenylate/guanylate cyclase domain-containing protein n=1 Tax=Micromonospora sp. WMMA1363 TaxID=3053985 RepID=UPI00259CCC7D|nr:adenylate/guanylate cyclase domain-containing protein [Micromonospora sp. WMMA1363]MDM4719505.1 adenylate/guanylate cyclase domain-containing protein [Micromonospora sp. WMMA1363]
MAMPLLGLWLLLARPQIDVHWHDPIGHFYLIATVALVNLVLGALVSAAAHRRNDARLFLVSLAFLASAGFLMLHALATPRVLVDDPNLGFELAQPVGLAFAAVFALASSLPLDGPRGAAILRARHVLWSELAIFLTIWGVASLLGLPPLSDRPSTAAEDAWLTWLAPLSVALLTVAAVRYFLLYRRQPTAVLISVITAFVLLAEAMVTVVLADKWALSWWEWHVLLALAFGFVAYSAFVQYRREGSSAGLFDGIALHQTIRAIRAEYGAALEELVSALAERERDGTGDVGPVAAGLADRFGLTERQTAVLERAAQALSAEREVSRRLSTLFRHYLSPDVAAALIADPDQAALGGSVVEVTALFADLRGFTTFSEAAEPAEIVAMLNRYHGVAVPCILDNGGTVVQFVGDALLALFNAPARQPDHALRAVRAATQMQHAVNEIATGHPGWPRFRVGVNTGPALVGNIGSEQLRGFNAMGDAVNVAARLQTMAEPGQIVIGESTWRSTNTLVPVDPLGDLAVKGRVGLVRAYAVRVDQ